MARLTEVIAATSGAMLLGILGSSPSAADFTVKGTQIIDPQEKVYIAKGVNINGYQTNWADEGKTIGDLNLVKNVWKFNNIRLYCRILPWNTANRSQFYNIIDAYIKAHVVVMLTYHDHTGGIYTGTDFERLKQFNIDIVNHFKTHPDFTYLWFESMNEPGSKPLNDIDNMNRSCLRTIREAGAKNNIFVAPGNNYSQEGVRWDSSPVTVGESYILSKGKAIQDYNESEWGNRNVIFSPHFYRIWIHGDTKMARFIDDCHSRNLPLVVGEYGVGLSDKSTAEATRSLVRVGYPRQIGRCVWHWTGGDNNKLTTRSGRDINRTDGGRPTNLSWLGGVVWDDNHRIENTGSTETRCAAAQAIRSSAQCRSALKGYDLYGRTTPHYTLNKSLLRLISAPGQIKSQILQQ